MKKIPALAFLILFAAAANTRLLAELPEDIFFKTLEQGFSYEYLYSLDDGKIWIKPNEKNTGKKGQWELFEKTGKPFGKSAASFKKTDRIIQFSTEGTMIVALSNRNRIYLWQPTYKKEAAWYDVTGAPFEDALYMPKNKTWSFAFSTMRAPWKRNTPMHEKDIVTYWEDIDGNKTEFGFTATVYSVDTDGRLIRYTDTGLPTSWNKAFTSPECGKFIIENISSSASTVFVTDAAGRMFTRMMDYEIEGGCPALRFSYKREKRTKGDEIAPLMTSIRTLPLPSWREQQPIEDVLDKKGQAAITKKITIVLTGKGNSERELRVQGRNADGKHGYWAKMIFGDKWVFVETGEEFKENEIITNYLNGKDEGQTLARTYKGTLKKNGQEDIDIELVDFHYFNSPCVLRVNFKNKHFDMIFHTVDLWNLVVQKKDHPELIGNPAGEPKLLQGTLEIPENILNTTDADIKNIIDEYFAEFNLQPLAFKVSADDYKVSIKSKTIQRSLDENLSYEFRSRISIKANAVSNKGSSAMSFYTSIAEAESLQIPDNWASMSKDDVPHVKKLLKLNAKTLDEMKALNKKFRKENLKAGMLSAAGLSSYYLFNGIISIIGLPSWNLVISDPGNAETFYEMSGVSYTGGTPFKEYAILNLKKALTNPEDYKKAVKILELRIKTLKKLDKWFNSER